MLEVLELAVYCIQGRVGHVYAVDELFQVALNLRVDAEVLFRTLLNFLFLAVEFCLQLFDLVFEVGVLVLRLEKLQLEVRNDLPLALQLQEKLV